MNTIFALPAIQTKSTKHTLMDTDFVHAAYELMHAQYIYPARYWTLPTLTEIITVRGENQHKLMTQWLMELDRRAKRHHCIAVTIDILECTDRCLRAKVSWGGRCSA